MPRWDKPGEGQKKREERLREEGHEVPKTMWIRSDVWAAFKQYQKEFKERHGFRITMKDMINEALFDLVMRKKLEELHGEPVRYEDTLYNVEQGTIRKKQG